MPKRCVRECSAQGGQLAAARESARASDMRRAGARAPGHAHRTTAAQHHGGAAYTRYLLSSSQTQRSPTAPVSEVAPQRFDGVRGGR